MRGASSKEIRASERVRVSRFLLPLDALVVAFGYLLVVVLRFNGDPPNVVWHAFEWFLPFAIGVHIAANWIVGLYGREWRDARIAEARRVRVAAFGSGVVLFAGSLAFQLEFPRSLIILGSLVVALFLGGVRLFRPVGVAHNETGGAA